MAFLPQQVPHAMPEDARVEVETVGSCCHTWGFSHSRFGSTSHPSLFSDLLLFNVNKATSICSSDQSLDAEKIC